MTSRTPENKQDGNIHDKKETGRTEKDKQNGKSHKSQYKTKNMKKNTETDELTQYGQHTEHVTLQEIISEYDIHDFFTYKEMDTFNMIIQPAYPIIRRNLIAFPKYSVEIKTTDTHIDEQPVI